MVTVGEGSVTADDCACDAGYYVGADSSCEPCPIDTYNPSAGATHSSQCHACAEGEKSVTNSASCEAPLPTSNIRQAVSGVKEGGMVYWQSGSGVLEQTWSELDGWEITKALTFMCSSRVVRCIIDAMAGGSGSSERRVLKVKHDGEAASNFVSLTVRGGNRLGSKGGGIRVDGGSKVNVIDCEISSNRAYNGGGISVSGIVHLHATVFLGNTASYGADVYGNNGGEIHVFGCTFSPPPSNTNLYTGSATITFEGSNCDAGKSTLFLTTSPPNPLPSQHTTPVANRLRHREVTEICCATFLPPLFTSPPPFAHACVWAPHFDRLCSRPCSHMYVGANARTSPTCLPSFSSNSLLQSR